MKPKGSGGKVLTVALCLLGLFPLCGFRYPVIGRDAVLQDLPRTLLWQSLGLAVFATAALVVLTKAPGERLGTLLVKWLFFYILGLLWSVTFLLAVNGIFDHGAHHLHSARLLDRRIVPSKRITQYYLEVADWQQPANRVTIEVDEALYDKIDKASSSDPMVQIETSPGFLGYERVIKVS